MVPTEQTHTTLLCPSTHTEAVTCSWSGSTEAGYERYSRAHEGHAPSVGAAVRLSADPAVRRLGQPERRPDSHYRRPASKGLTLPVLSSVESWEPAQAGSTTKAPARVC
jgi:hypothetical protein